MESLSQQFERLKVCVLVPTFNNAATLAVLLKELQVIDVPVIVINDGSSDDTVNVLLQLSLIHI